MDQQFQCPTIDDDFMSDKSILNFLDSDQNENKYTYSFGSQTYYQDEQNYNCGYFLNFEQSNQSQQSTDISSSLALQNDFSLEHQQQHYCHNCQNPLNMLQNPISQINNNNQPIQKKKKITKSKNSNNQQQQFQQNNPNKTKRVKHFNQHQELSSAETKNLFVLLVPILQKKILEYYPLSDKLQCLKFNKKKQNSLIYLNEFLMECIQNQCNQYEKNKFIETSIFILRSILIKYSLNCKNIKTNYLTSKYGPAFQMILQHPGHFNSIKDALAKFKKYFIKKQ